MSVDGPERESEEGEKEECKAEQVCMCVEEIPKLEGELSHISTRERARPAGLKAQGS